jgi:hypothetical protein
MSVAPRGLRGDSPAQRYAKREPQGWLPRGWIDGLILSNDGTDATNDIAISAGTCRSTSNIGSDGIRTTLPKYQADLEIPVAIIKQLDVAWAPENYDPENGIGGGGRSGMRSSSSISNTTWHVFAIGGLDCPTDIFAHDGVDPSAVLPNGYAAWRRIGSLVRLSAAIKPFNQVGDHVVWATPVNETVSTAFSVTLRNYAITVPTGVAVLADVTVFGYVTGAATSVVVGSPSATGIATPTHSGGVPTAPSSMWNEAVTAVALNRFPVMTDTSAQISVRASDTCAGFDIHTFGYTDFRGKDV